MLAGWSRLAFIVRDDQLPIDWTMPKVLEAIGDMELSVAPNALPPRDPPRRINPLLEGMLQPAAVVERAILSAAGATGSSSAMQPVSSALLAAEAASRDIRSVARDRRMIRTVGYALGLSDVSGSATVGLIDELIESELVLPIDLTRPVPRAPTATETALELPYRLILSPNRHAAWFHSSDPAWSNVTRHTELWHTRLGVRPSEGDPFEGPDKLRTVRAIWTTDSDPPETPPPSDEEVSVDVPDPSIADPFRSSLDRFDRHNIVHLSSNFRLHEEGSTTRFYEPRAIDVNNLALSSLGGWLDSRGAWDEQPLGLSVEEWRHRATLGRDHYVRVVYAGRLFPLGHRVSLIKVTERRFEEEKPGHPAYLRQMMFVVVREPIRTYRSSGLKYDGTDASRAGERWDLKLPFTAARITTTVSPLLDPPGDTDIAGLQNACFWPYVGRQPFRFHVIATDIVGQTVELEMPLIFVIQGETDEQYADSIVPPDEAKDDDETVTNDYRTRTWPGKAQLLAEVPIGGQQVAFAPRGKPDDTSVAVQTLTFDVEVPQAATYDKMARRQPRWVPVMRQAKIDVPSLQRIAGTSAPAPVVYPGAYLAGEFTTGNAGQVFLAADPAAAEARRRVQLAAQIAPAGSSPPTCRSAASPASPAPFPGRSPRRRTAASTRPPGSAVPSALRGSSASCSSATSSSPRGSTSSTRSHDSSATPSTTSDGSSRTSSASNDFSRREPVPQATAVLTTLEQLTDPDTGSIPGLLTGGNPGAVAAQLAALNGQLAGLPASLEASTLGAGPQSRHHRCGGVALDGDRSLRPVPARRLRRGQCAA